MQRYVDAIIIANREVPSVLLIRPLRDPTRWCLPGGFLEQGESALDACCREIAEETALESSHVSIFADYLFADERPRITGSTTVFLSHAPGEPEAGDDALEARYFPLYRTPLIHRAHDLILCDFRIFLATGSRPHRVSLLPAHETEVTILAAG